MTSDGKLSDVPYAYVWGTSGHRAEDSGRMCSTMTAIMFARPTQRRWLSSETIVWSNNVSKRQRTQNRNVDVYFSIFTKILTKKPLHSRTRDLFAMLTF